MSLVLAATFGCRESDIGVTSSVGSSWALLLRHQLYQRQLLSFDETCLLVRLLIKATMDPFQQQTFFAEPHWQYPNADATFVPVAEGQEMTYFHPPGHAAYPIEQSDSTAQVQYMSEQPAPRVNEAQIFPIPGGVPATTYPIVRVRRPARRDLTDTDDGERREKIRRTRTVSRPNAGQCVES